MAEIIDGKLVAKKIKENVRIRVAACMQKSGLQPALATILVGEDPASHIYVKNKIKSTESCGMKSIHYKLAKTISQTELLELIIRLNNDKSVHGILVQLPLPKHIDANLILGTIDPRKDVDGFHPCNAGLLMAGQDCLMPCTPLGIMELLKHYNLDPAGQDTVIVGRSNIVGKPQAMMMIKASATVTVCHSKTKNLPDKIKNADIVVAAIGRAGFIKGNWIKTGAVVIDVGMNRDETGKLCGDVDFDLAKDNASYITPVPGGVGPMTIAMLMSNTLKAYERLV